MDWGYLHRTRNLPPPLDFPPRPGNTRYLDRLDPSCPIGESNTDPAASHDFQRFVLRFLIRLLLLGMCLRSLGGKRSAICNGLLG